MAKDDRNARARAGITGESYQQALERLREDGLMYGLVPDAADPAQQILEAAVLRALARPPLAVDRSLFGITRVSPTREGLTLWPARGAAGAVLARLLPATTAGIWSGVPALRLERGTGTQLALQAAGPAQVLVRARPDDHREALRILAQQGVTPCQGAPGADELAAWQQVEGDLEADAARWSAALRRAALFLPHPPDWTGRAPSQAEVALPAGLNAPSDHRPAPPRPPKMTVAVTSPGGKGGEGRSTVALSLARELARQSAAVLLLTADEFFHDFLRHQGSVDWWAAGEHLPGPGRGSMAVAFWNEREDTQLVELARRKADVVVLDTSFSYRAGTVPVDVEVPVCRYRPQAWTKAVREDYRPESIRVLEWLDERFDSFCLTAGREADREAQGLPGLLSALDDMFLTYALMRISGHDGEELYDRDDEDAANLFWEAPPYPQDSTRGEGLLPAEDRAPLEQWREEFLAYLEPDGRSREPQLWPRAAAVWAEHSRRRNREFLRPGDPVAADLRGNLDAFVQQVAGDAVEQWGDAFTAVVGEFTDGVLHRWLEETFTSFLGTRDRPTPGASGDLVAVLETRFAEFARRKANAPQLDADAPTPPPVPTAVATDEWWSAQAPPTTADEDAHEVDERGLESWREEFLDQVDAEGYRRHPGAWAQARAQWIQRGRNDLRFGCRVSDAELLLLTDEFTRLIAPVASEAWGSGWRPVAQAWRDGKEPLLLGLDAYDDHITSRLLDRDPTDTAAHLLARPSGAANTVVVLNHSPKDLPAERLAAVGTALRGYGIAGLVSVASSRALDVIPSGDRNLATPPPAITRLARVVTTAGRAGRP
ncbi:hypothetical protein [Kitasatospora sp. NPDC088783]|uniref:hypothetical protein n=1 Tax=Kitasatospora sp. NPDC088783 TaxID=3364077 RepID=UPI0037F5E5D6